MSVMYTPLAEITLGSSASSVTFASIPNTFRDLMVVVEGYGTGPGDLVVSYNGDTSNTYTNIYMGGGGSSASSAAFTRTGGFIVFIATDIRFHSTCSILDYATDKQKLALAGGNRPTEEVQLNVSRWPSTAAINSVAVRAVTNAISSGSTVALYGVK